MVAESPWWPAMPSPLLLLAACLPAGAAPAAGAEAPFVWTLAIDGGAKATVTGSGSLPWKAKGWDCGYAVDPVEPDGENIAQWGSLSCTHRKTGQALDTLVLCLQHPDRATDVGSGNLSIQLTGESSPRVAELTCRSPGAPERARLHLGPAGAPGSSGPVSQPDLRGAVQAGSFDWRVSRIGAGLPGTNEALPGEGGTLDMGLPGWSCTARARGVEDQVYGYAEVGSMDCLTPFGARFVIDLPCVKQPGEAHTCMMAPLRIDDGSETVRSISLSCEDVGNPGCIGD